MSGPDSTSASETTVTQDQTDFDVVVIGAGLGGLYAVHRFRRDGLRVVALESASGVGGVWFHNRYPGARVDLDSLDYCYFFSPEVYREWRWSERYAAQPELLAYLNFVADRLDLRPHIRLNTRVAGAEWRPEPSCYELRTQCGERLTTRFLVNATGNLSEPRAGEILPGMARFTGELIQTQRWPDRPVATAGRRVAVIGTGSSGVQTITALAGQAAHLYVFQRTANYVVPAQNGPLDNARFTANCHDLPGTRAGLLRGAGTTPSLDPPRQAETYTPEERQARLEAQWRAGGQGMNGVFADQSTDERVNTMVAQFVRDKIRKAVTNPILAEKLCPSSYPIGTRRLILQDGYYEIYNRTDVTLVDVTEDPLLEITATGIRTATHHYEVDVIITALGFDAFTGAIDRVGIRNEHGASPTDAWDRGPRTLLGLMTGGFPNLFLLTGPGSPSVLANMFLMNELHADWVAECIAWMDRRGYRTIEPTEDGMARWGEIAQAAAGHLLRLKVENYMARTCSDGTRVFFPFAGGLQSYLGQAGEIAENDYAGFRFTSGTAAKPEA